MAEQRGKHRGPPGPGLMSALSSKHTNLSRHRQNVRLNQCHSTLTPQQGTAVDLLASGKTLTDTATAVEVTRQTVSEWLNHHPGFQAALNSRRQELWAGMADALRGLLPKALEVLKGELEGETPLPAAVHVLKACGLYGMVIPLGPTEVDDALLAEQERQSERRRRAVFAASF
jgi:hypothetical protein